MKNPVADFDQDFVDREIAVSLEWGVKESFREYFERLADHKYEFGPGSMRTPDGTFAFEAVPERTLEFHGSLKMEAHFGALSVALADPAIEGLAGGRGVLTAAVDEQKGEPVRMAVANVEFSHWAGMRQTRQAVFDAVLAKEGQYLFMGHYFEGDLMDQILLTFEAGPASTESAAESN